MFSVMTRRAQPLHVKVMGLVMAEIVMCLNLPRRVALRAHVGADKAPGRNGVMDGRFRSSEHSRMLKIAAPPVAVGSPLVFAFHFGMGKFPFPNAANLAGTLLGGVFVGHYIG